MLNEIVKDEFLPSFQYLIDEKKFIFDNTHRILKGTFEFKNSPYLWQSDDILNMEDDIFIMTQSLYVLFAEYYNHNHGITYEKFADELLGNIVVTKVNYTFHQIIFKNTDENCFSHQLLDLTPDRKNQLWYNSLLSISNQKHICTITGCVMTKEVHWQGNRI